MARHDDMDRNAAVSAIHASRLTNPLVSVSRVSGRHHSSTYRYQ